MLRILIVFFLFSSSINADQFDLRLENLFDELLETDDESEIYQISLNIWDIWHETNDLKIKSDFIRGVGLMHNGNLKKSIIYFTKVIKNNPNFAEAWNKRATVYYMLGNFNKSMLDINQTLKLEPRHFGALDGMALIFIHQKNYKKALETYDEIIKIFPKSNSAQDKKKQLLNHIYKSA